MMAMLLLDQQRIVMVAMLDRRRGRIGSHIERGTQALDSTLPTGSFT